MGFDSFKTQREIRRADLFKESASSSAKAALRRFPEPTHAC
jgi:hypothetical protein